MTFPVTIPGATRPSPASSSSGLCLRIATEPTAAIQGDASRLAPLSLGHVMAIAAVENRRSSALREIGDGEFCSLAFSEFDTRLYSGIGSGQFRRPAALGLLLHFLPCGFRFLPKEIPSNGKERRANFFRVPPEKQTFGTWEPGPLPRLRQVCPKQIRELKTENKTCI